MNIILLNDGSCIVTAEDPDNIADDNPGWDALAAELWPTEDERPGAE